MMRVLCKAFLVEILADQEARENLESLDWW